MAKRICCSQPERSVAESSLVNENNVPQGFISLFELTAANINTGTDAPPDGTSVYQFISKESARIAFKTISTSDFDSLSQFGHGDIIKSAYPLSSSIYRTRFESVSSATKTVETLEENGSFIQTVGNKRRVLALRNSFNKYINIVYITHLTKTQCKIICALRFLGTSRFKRCH